MLSDKLKAKVLAAVAGGSSLSDAARANDLTPGQGRDAVSRLCRNFKLSPDISDIRANPKTYLELASRITSDPRHALRKELRSRIQRLLQLRSIDELTQKYISNLTAAMVLETGITEIGLAEIQEWLVDNGASLKLQAPSKHEHMVSVKRAIFLLDSFGFDTTMVSSQLKGLDG